jgi:hypothetical protein
MKKKKTRNNKFLLVEDVVEEFQAYMEEYQE